MQPVPSQPPGKLLGGLVGMKIWERYIPEKLPSGGNQDSVKFARELIGLFNVAENTAAAFCLYAHPKYWTPKFRGDLSEGIRMFVTANTRICLAEVLLREPELKHFCGFYWQRIETEGKQAVLHTQHSVRDAFVLIQEVRNLEFAAVTKADPQAYSSVRAPDPIRRISAAIIECVHFWILSSPTRTEESLATADGIVDPLLVLVTDYCNRVMRDPDSMP